MEKESFSFLSKWNQIKDFYFELGRPGFPKSFKKEYRDNQRLKTINKLVATGMDRYLLGELTRKELHSTYCSIFGKKKVTHFNSKFIDIEPFFLEFKTKFDWISSDIKGRKPKRKIEKFIIKTLHGSKEGNSFIETLTIVRSGNKYKMVSKIKEAFKVSYNCNFKKSIVIKKRFLTDDFKRILPIKTSRSCLFMGMAPFKVPNKPQEVIPPKRIAVDFAEKNRDQIDNKLEHKFAIQGSWISQVKEFQHFCDPIMDNKNTKTNLDILKIIKKRLHKIKLPIGKETNREMIDLVQTNLDAHAGLIYQVLLKKYKHNDVDDYLRPVSKKIFDRIQDTIYSDSSLWCIGGRTRMMKQGKVGEDLRSRLLIMPDGAHKIMGLLIIQEFYNDLVSLQKFELDNEISLGINFRGDGFKKFINVNKEYEDVLELDFKRFDQSISKEVIETAFSILRSCYPVGHVYDKIFFYLLGSFLYKNIVIPGGFIYRISKSIATGSPFTSIIGTLCNWINLTLMLNKMKLNKNTYDSLIRTYGDDTLIFFKNFTNYSSLDFLEVCKDLNGQIADPICIKRVKDVPQLEIGYSFLKTQDYYGFAGRTTAETMERALYPEEKWEINSLEGRLEGSFYNAPFNYKSSDMLRKFINEIRKVNFSKIGMNTQLVDYSNETFFKKDIVNKARANYIFVDCIFKKNDLTFHWEKKIFNKQNLYNNKLNENRKDFSLSMAEKIVIMSNLLNKDKFIKRKLNNEAKWSKRRYNSFGVGGGMKELLRSYCL